MLLEQPFRTASRLWDWFRLFYIYLKLKYNNEVSNETESNNQI